MQICRTIGEIRGEVAAYRAGGDRIALVPTMGFLHDGHMALVERARAEGGRVVVWIFVNPTQFENPDDLDAYPRDLERDLAMLRDAGVDAVFTPEAREIYPEGAETIVETTRMANMLHGEVRPGHYRGVTTVVAKFFNIIAPDCAVFGEKDYQQLQIIRRMVRDLHMPVEIIGVPTVREADGLALSSRNVRLSPADRTAAAVLSTALDRAEALAASGTTVAALRQDIEVVIASEPRATLTGLDIVRAETLADISGPLDGPTAIMLSVQFGEVLLIDQRVVGPGKE
ncbi:pantoate--beta-alanine ligase [Poseidonocella sedimentorum]|uniref:Pantothenate synthetase n=1 Tax=Poseidonocella sedimentorum TaxID=871652 RepID=A0A1I6EF42_9RHOB|nr:pantoate--beta-alanine ligase [Poseidonocella sedimentorum]SFR16267.1 pantothenate synthetase [Poseidonocella sedimentorum]